MKQEMKTQSNYGAPVTLLNLPAFIYKADASYQDQSSAGGSPLWESLGDFDRVIPGESKFTLWDESTIDTERVVLSFKQAIECLRSDALELMYVAKSGDGYIEIWIYGNRIPEQTQNRIHEIDFEFSGRFPGAIGDIHVSDRRGRPMSKHATFDLTTEDSYALYRLSPQLWLPKHNMSTSGNATMISLQS